MLDLKSARMILGYSQSNLEAITKRMGKPIYQTQISKQEKSGTGLINVDKRRLEKILGMPLDWNPKRPAINELNDLQKSTVQDTINLLMRNTDPEEVSTWVTSHSNMTELYENCREILNSIRVSISPPKMNFERRK